MWTFVKIVAGGAIGATVALVAIGGLIWAVIDGEDDRSENDFHQRLVAGSCR